jgi:hypothetical protein
MSRPVVMVSGRPIWVIDELHELQPPKLPHVPTTGDLRRAHRDRVAATIKHVADLRQALGTSGPTKDRRQNLRVAAALNDLAKFVRAQDPANPHLVAALADTPLTLNSRRYDLTEPAVLWLASFGRGKHRWRTDPRAGKQILLQALRTLGDIDQRERRELRRRAELQVRRRELRRAHLARHGICGCGRDYLTVPLEESHVCPSPRAWT